MAPLQSVALAATGGSGTGYTWALRTNGSGGSVDSTSGAYKAGVLPNAADTVQATDSLGNMVSSSSRRARG